MLYPLLADAVLLLHLAFVLFALFGGLLVVRHPKAAWLHLPALAWGIIVEWADLVCPLTPLENALRLRGGEAVYGGGFIEHYVSLLLYPEVLTPQRRYVFGAMLLLVNVLAYARVMARRHS